MDKGKIRVLLSAYACEPGKGSEPGVGWNVARELSSRVSLWVITRANNRTLIEDSCEAWTQQVQWIYWDTPQWLTFWKKGGRGVQLFYGIWQYGVKAVAEKALATYDFDIIHHLTFGKYWVPSRLAALGVPFVFGPVGGGETSPPRLGKGNGFRGYLAELSKKSARTFVAWFPPTRRLLQKAAWTFAATPQTEKALRATGVTRLSVLTQSGIAPMDSPPFPIRDCTEAGGSFTGPLQLITASRLIHWKAIDLVIEAVASLPANINVRLCVLQEGP